MANPVFDYDSGTDTLTLTTDTMVLTFQTGVVTGVQDRVRSATPLAITSNPFGSARWTITTDFVGAGFRTPDDSYYYIVGNSVCYDSTTINSDFSRTYNYVDCYTGPTNNSYVTGTAISYRFDVDARGDIAISMSGNGVASTNPWEPSRVDLPIFNFDQTVSGHSIISGATQFKNNSATSYFQVSQRLDGYCSAVVLETATSCVGAWSEDSSVSSEKMFVDQHVNSYAHFQFSKQTSTEDIDANVGAAYPVFHGGPWRFTVQATWLDVAKRWRLRFEEMHTNYKYLWENDTVWVRDIHALYTRNYPITATWLDIAKIGGSTVLDTHILWQPDGNGGGELVVYGDNDYVKTDAYPRSDSNARTLWAAAGVNFKVLGYYGCFCLIAVDPALELNSDPGHIPGGYVQNLDIGPPLYDISGGPVSYNGGWTTFLTTCNAVYHSDVHAFYVLHLGTTNGAAYVRFNYPDYCSKNTGRDGAYWDILGTDPVTEDAKWVAGSRVVNGSTSAQANIAAAADLHVANPIMSEDILRDLIPYIFYSWSPGPLNIVQQGDTPYVNHPFRTAQVGSYLWTKPEHPTWTYNLDLLSLLGALPEFMMDGDYPSDNFCPLSRAIARLFCTYEMYNDLPTTWGDASTNLAYYRTNSTGKFKFVKRGTGRYAFTTENDAYVLQTEIHTSVACNPFIDVTFADAYLSVPTVKAQVTGGSIIPDGNITNLTTTGCRITSSGPNINWLVFDSQPAPTYSRGDYGSLPGTDADLEIPYSSTDVTYVATDDDTTYVSQGAASQYAIHEFKNDATGKSIVTVTS